MKKKHSAQPPKDQLDVGLRIVNQQSRRAYARFDGSIDLSDLMNAGFDGLERGFRSYVQGRADLSVHLRRNVRWAIASAVRTVLRRRKRLGQLRRWQGLGRSHRRVRGGRGPLSCQHASSEPSPGTGGGGGYAAGETPETMLEERRRRDSVRAAIAALEPALSALMREHYLKQRQLRDVREELQLNATRATRMHRRARARLRLILRDHQPE